MKMSAELIEVVLSGGPRPSLCRRCGTHPTATRRVRPVLGGGVVVLYRVECLDAACRAPRDEVGRGDTLEEAVAEWEELSK